MISIQHMTPFSNIKQKTTTTEMLEQILNHFDWYQYHKPGDQRAGNENTNYVRFSITWNLAISDSTKLLALSTGTLQFSTQLFISSCLLLRSKHSYAHLK